MLGAAVDHPEVLAARATADCSAELHRAAVLLELRHKASLGLPRALNNAAIAALIAAATAGKALVDDDCAKKAVAELTRE
jgi:type II secretory pathway predicted ATPase ExeA